MTATQSRTMLLTAPPSLSRFSSPYAKSCSLSSARPALADSTNAIPRSDAGHSKRFVYPTSTRTSCAWNDVELSTGSISSHSRHHHLCSPSPFTVISKAPPTVSISLSAACSQSIPRQCTRGSRVQGSEPDLPDVRSVVPFPSTSLDSDMDVEMVDGTCVGHLPPSVGQAPRKRRSAHSSISSSQGCSGKDANQKRPRKSKRHVAELWWLGVVYRSISRSIEARLSDGSLNSIDTLCPGPLDFDAMDHVLVERIQKRLAENGCIEGRLPTCPLPRVSSPSISVPSLGIGRKILPADSVPLPPSSVLELSLKENATSSRVCKASPLSSTSSLIVSHCPVPSTASTSNRRHVRFEIAPRPRPLQSHLGIPRRSPSPPARTGAVPANGQTLTLTMPQLVASLTLAFNDRNRARIRGRTCRPSGYGKDASRFPSSAPSQDVRCDNGDATREKERMLQLPALCARLSSAPERRSPLSCIAYADG